MVDCPTLPADSATRVPVAQPAPRAGAFAITDRGIPAWLAGDRLLALNRCGPVELDHGGTIANLSASGATVAWTHDGSPRTAALAW